MGVGMPGRIWFVRTKGIWAMLYRLFHFTTWDTVAIELEKDTVYYVHPKTKVIKTSSNLFSDDIELCVFINVSIINKRTIHNFLESQLGKPYDWCSFFYLPVVFRSDIRKRWGSADLIAEALQLGLPRFSFTHDYPTPSELWVDIHLHESKEPSTLNIEEPS